MLQEMINTLPAKPGCYLYFNDKQHVIYVGKAKNLKKRVASYFDRVHNFKTTKLVKEIVDIKYFVVSNEKEALLLEENLIKQYRPKYNVLLNDDKAYPYIIITNEIDPTYKYVRKLDKKALRSFGPLPLGSNARETLIILQRLFPLRRCKGHLDKPCLHYFINQCSGACFKTVDPKYYETQIKSVDNFFKGNINEVKQALTKAMHQAADNLQYEQAQRLKDSIDTLKFTTAKQHVEFSSHKNVDVISYCIENTTIAITILFYRAGQLMLKDEHVQVYFEQDINDLLNSYLSQIYHKNILPDKIIVPSIVDLSSMNLKFQLISTHPINRDEHKMFAIALANSQDAIRKSLINSNVNMGHELELLNALMRLSGLSAEPRRIEMFDIANLGNDFITGSCIVYINGKPVRNEFRKYNIDAQFNSDYERLKTMLYRRFQKALMEKRELPDLIIMDGGIIQIHAAKQILSLLDLATIPVIGLVKNENHRTDKLIDIHEQVHPLSKTSKLYNWLSLMQSRVDEYAKAGLRNKQSASLLRNELSQISGLGPKRIQALFKKFNTLNEIKAASDEELLTILKNKRSLSNLKKFLA